MDDCSSHGWGVHEGNCYKLFSTDKATQSDACDKCQSQGGTLYKPSDKAEEEAVTEFVQSQFGHPDDYFIGLRLKETDPFSGKPYLLNCYGTDANCKGKTIGYQNWRSDGMNFFLPFKTGLGICINKNKKWTNLDHMEKHAYLCKKPQKS